MRSLAAEQIAQINHSYTAMRGTVRGMHFQRPPHAEMKFVSCLRGADLRCRGGCAPRFADLSALARRTAQRRQPSGRLLIPEGFAHGFQTLTDDCELLYFHTAAYQPAAEAGLNPQDPRLAIEWPLPVAGLSPRDAAHPLLDDDFAGVAP